MTNLSLMDGREDVGSRDTTAQRLEAMGYTVWRHSWGPDPDLLLVITNDIVHLSKEDMAYVGRFRGKYKLPVLLTEPAGLETTLRFLERGRSDPLVISAEEAKQIRRTANNLLRLVEEN